jgi:predicted DNA-binding protein with PD1-like motif
MNVGLSQINIMLKEGDSMEAKLIHEQHGQKTVVIVFDKGDEFISRLTEFARKQELVGSHFTAIGAFSRVVLGYFDRHKMGYKKIPLNEQVEVLSLTGNIALDKDKPKVHAHAVVGRSDGTTRGGHVLEAHVWPTLEVVIVSSPKPLQRKIDEETGLALIDLEAPREVIMPEFEGGL